MDFLFFFCRVVSMEDVIETMTGVEIVDEDDVAVDMQALAKEKSRMMHQVIDNRCPADGLPTR